MDIARIHEQKGLGIGIPCADMILHIEYVAGTAENFPKGHVPLGKGKPHTYIPVSTAMLTLLRHGAWAVLRTADEQGRPTILPGIPCQNRPLWTDGGKLARATGE